VIDKSGAWFYYGEMRLGQGRENVRDFLRSNPDVTDKIVSTLRERLANQRAPKPEGTEVAGAPKPAEAAQASEQAGATVDSAEVPTVGEGMPDLEAPTPAQKSRQAAAPAGK